MKRKINELEIDQLNLTESLRTQLSKLLLNSDKFELESSREEIDELVTTESSSTNNENGIFMLTKEKEELLDFADQITDPEQQRKYLLKLKNVIKTTPEDNNNLLN